MAQANEQPLRHMSDATIARQFNTAGTHDVRLHANDPTDRRHPSTSQSHHHSNISLPNYPINPLNGHRTSPRRLRELQQQAHARHANGERPLPSLHSILGPPGGPPLPNAKQTHASPRGSAVAVSDVRNSIDDRQRVLRLGETGSQGVREERVDENEDEDEHEDGSQSDDSLPDGRGLVQQASGVAISEGSGSGRGRGRGQGRGQGRGGRSRGGATHGGGQGTGGRSSNLDGKKAAAKKCAKAKSSTKKGKGKAEGKGSRSGTNRREGGASDVEIMELDADEVDKVLAASERAHWTEEEKMKVIKYICDPERFVRFKAAKAHILQKVFSSVSKIHPSMSCRYMMSSLPFLSYHRLYKKSFMAARPTSRSKASGLVPSICTKRVAGVRRTSKSTLVVVTRMSSAGWNRRKSS